MVTTRKKARVTSASQRRPPKDHESPVKKFFTLVLPSTMKRNMMRRIPPKFVKLHGSKLSDVVTLETPVGFKHSIKLKWIGEDIWFEEGWSEFAEAHSINVGYFLLFECKGNSSFRVIIFNVSASEINYPLNASAVHISDSDCDSDDDIIEVTENVFFGKQGIRGNDESINGGGSEHKSKKRSSGDIDFDNILHDIDVINSIQVLEEEGDKRVFRGKESY